MIALYNLEPQVVNSAMMRVSSYHKNKGDQVELYNHLEHNNYEKIYAFSLCQFTSKSMVTNKMICGGTGFDNLWARGYYIGSAGHVSQEQVKRYIQEQMGKDVFEYDIYGCPTELKGQLKIGDFCGN